MNNISVADKNEVCREIAFSCLEYCEQEIERSESCPDAFKVLEAFPWFGQFRQAGLVGFEAAGQAMNT